MLEEWMRSYKPEELFDQQGRFVHELAELAPNGKRRMGSNPHSNGGALLRDLLCPIFDLTRWMLRSPARCSRKRRASSVSSARHSEPLDASRNFRVFGPDETTSNRLDAVFEVTDRDSTAHIIPTDDHVSPDGRVMEGVSEHMCQGWLEGYLLTGRHGFFSCYEAFIHIMDSMFNQHAKWLKVPRTLRGGVPSRHSIICSLRTSGGRTTTALAIEFPGFIDHVVNKKADIVRVYLPPDANYAALGRRPLPAQPRLRQRHCGRQAAGVAMARHGCCHCALHRRSRHLGLGQQRPRR